MRATLLGLGAQDASPHRALRPRLRLGARLVVAAFRPAWACKAWFARPEHVLHERGGYVQSGHRACEVSARTDRPLLVHPPLRRLPEVARWR